MSKFKLELREKQKASYIAESSADGSINPIVQNDTTDISKRISEEMYKYREGKGTIHQVLPVNNRVFVSVFMTGEVDKLGHDLSDKLYNSYNMELEDIPLLQTMLPLVNFDQEILQLDLSLLVGKKVKVRILEGFYAINAELVSSFPDDALHKGEPHKMDIHQIMTYGFKDIWKSLERVGYAKENLDEFKKLKVKEHSDPGVFRFKNEAYWDKDTNQSKDMDILLKDDFVGLIGRNYLEMKSKLCHTPIIMFSGK